MTQEPFKGNENPKKQTCMFLWKIWWKVAAMYKYDRWKMSPEEKHTA